MLGDQGSPYVGRFARGWHRLPGLIPGQPQTRTGARPSIGAASGTARAARPRRPVGERATGGEEVDLARPGLEERSRAGRSGRARRQHVIDEEQSRWRRLPGDAYERIGHRLQSLFAGSPRLWSGRLRPPDEVGRGEIQLACERLREHASLVETPLGPPPARERHPRHRVGRRRAEHRESRCERLPDPTPPGELQTMDRRPSGPAVGERGARRCDLRRGAVTASIHVLRRRPSASTAPRWLQRDELPGTRLAERPRARAASRAGTREDDVDRSIEHLPVHRRHATACRRHDVRATRPRSALPHP